MSNNNTGAQIDVRACCSDRGPPWAKTCVIASSIPPGVTVPVHSHDERETFYIVSGSLEVFDAAGWRTISSGSVFDMPPRTKHAFRNISVDPVSVVLVVPTRLAQFSASIGRPICSLPVGATSPDAVQTFFSAALEEGLWPGPLERQETTGILLFLTAMGQAEPPIVSET